MTLSSQSVPVLTSDPEANSTPLSTEEISRDVAAELTSTTACDIGWVRRSNRLLSSIAREDMSRACLSFRAISNGARLVEACRLGSPFALSAGYERVISSLAEGSLVASGFQADRTTAMTVGVGELRVAGTSLMVTGGGHASHLVVEAAIDDDHDTSVLILPAEAIVRTTWPRLRGLNDADNALLDLDVVVPYDEVMLSHRGAGRRLVETPYRAGLTFGAVAHGGMLAILDNLHVSAETMGLRGLGLAETAAAGALVEASGSAYGDAVWASRAAKVFATIAAERFATAAVASAGAAAYSVNHPLNRLNDDIAGLRFQAPTNVGSLRYLAEAAETVLSASLRPDRFRASDGNPASV